MSFFKIIPLLIFISHSYAVEKICEDIGLHISKDETPAYQDLRYLRNRSDSQRGENGYKKFINYTSPRRSSGHLRFLQTLDLISHSKKLNIQPTSLDETVHLLEEISNKISVNEINNLNDIENLNLFTRLRLSKLYERKKTRPLKFGCYSVMALRECPQAFEAYMKRANLLHSGRNYFLFPELLKKVLSNPVHQEVLISAVKILIHKSIEYLRSQKIPSNDIYHEITTVAQAKGLSITTAHSVALEILGAYSIRGAAYFNNEGREFLLHAKSSGLSLLMLSTLISYFDKIKFYHAKKLYSLPSQYIQTTCHYGKPYRFWMGAYSSFVLMNKDRFTPRTSILVSHLASTGYELWMHANGRDDYFQRIVNARSIKNIDVRNAKLDVVMGSLGAGFGVSPLEHGQLNADLILKRSFRSGIASKARFNNDYLNYLKWGVTVAPHSHLNMILPPR